MNEYKYIPFFLLSALYPSAAFATGTPTFGLFFLMVGFVLFPFLFAVLVVGHGKRKRMILTSVIVYIISFLTIISCITMFGHGIFSLSKSLYIYAFFLPYILLPISLYKRYSKSTTNE